LLSSSARIAARATSFVNSTTAEAAPRNVMTPRPKPKRFPGESPILRRHFIHELLAHDYAGDLEDFLADLFLAHPFSHAYDPRPAPDITHLLIDTSQRISRDYLRHAWLTELGRLYFWAWLQSHGIDPDTGRMTLKGFAFFKAVLDDQTPEQNDRRKRAA
jgi:hypothetical protein